MEEIFTNVYEICFWGNNKNSNYKGSSGPGSDISYNEKYIPFLKKWINDNSIKSVVDLGCGDFKCGKLIYDDLDVSYTGYDAYNKLIEYHQENIQDTKYEFIHKDIFQDREQLKSADVCILKDVLQHWKTEDIYTFLDYIVQSKKYEYILICNCCKQVMDDQTLNTTGHWRQLSCEMLPLKKYNPVKLFTFNTKQICLINVNAKESKGTPDIQSARSPTR